MARRSLTRSPRGGLTLVELVVVLMILIALAGVLVPMLPSMLTRAHTSTCSTNIGEAVKAINQYQALYGFYPNNWDALCDNGGNIITYFANGSSCPPQYYTGGTMNPGAGELTAFKLTANEASALAGVGITTLQTMLASGAKAGVPTVAGFDPTFNNYGTGGTITVNTAPTLVGLDPTNAANTAAISKCQLLNLPLTGRYVALGIGPLNSMVGKTIASAPVHFGDQPVLNPEYGYERLVAIFKVSDSAASAFTQAQLVGVGPVHDTGMGRINDELQNFYQIQIGGS